MTPAAPETPNNPKNTDYKISAGEAGVINFAQAKFICSEITVL